MSEQRERFRLAYEKRRKQQEDTEEYIGDGLYVSFDGYSFWLRAPRPDGDYYVCLEPAVMYAFDAYRKTIFTKIIG